MQIDLKEAVPRHHIAERAVGVVLRRGENVRYGAAVVSYVYWRAEAGDPSRSDRGSSALRATAHTPCTGSKRRAGGGSGPTDCVPAATIAARTMAPMAA